MDHRLAARMQGIEPSFIRQILSVTKRAEVISFAGGLPHPDTFPVEDVREATGRVLSGRGKRALQYTTTAGVDELRGWIAARYATRFDMTVDPDAILIVNGSQQALDLIAKILLDPGDHVLVEAPSYLGALQSLSLYQPSVRTVVLGSGGAEPGSFASALADHDPKLFYSVPNFQNPTGISYDAVTRAATARMLADSETLLIEDDPYGELRFRGVGLDPVSSGIRDRSFLMGSFSKVVAPGLRMGWVVAPPSMIEPLHIVKQAADLHSNHLAQEILVELLGSFDLDAHLDATRARYAAGLTAMEEALDALLPDGSERTRPEGGMFLWLTLPIGLTAREVLDEAIARDVVFVPGDAFFLDGRGERSMRLNFTNGDPALISEGVHRLAEAIEAVAARRRSQVGS